MSTPSTATITVPPNHQYYPHQAQYLPAMTDYHNNPPYQQPSSRGYTNGYANNPPSADVRRPPATAQRPSQPQSQPSYNNNNNNNNNNYETASAATSSSSAKKRGRDDPVDWERYFGGKPPKEIIVIDDDEPSPSYPPPNRSGVALPQQPAPAAIANGLAHHAEKRRKTQATTANYDPVYQQQTSYSNTQTPYSYEGSPGDYAASTNRTNSYNTTAPTSLGSQVSNGAYLEEGTVGQKRKRTTRQGAADQKRREVEARSDPYAEYIPPPRPPIKAKDVFVNVVPDRTATRDQKVDDDDGHYIVVDNSDITERYSIVKLLGQGTFGKVVQAWDRKRQSDVAIKIIRSVQKYRDASRIELRVLSTLASNDKHNRNKCIHLRDTFDFRNHICIVTKKKKKKKKKKK